jgi:hypothetical protein
VDQYDNPMNLAKVIVTSAVKAGAFSDIATEEPHGLIAGDVVVIAGHVGSDPDINGEQTVTASVDANTFEIGVDVTTGGTVGTFKKVTSTGLVADLHVTALTLGTHTGLVVRLLDSADDDTYAPVVSFTAVTLINANERKTVATEVQRYVAIDGDFTGAGSPSAVPLVAVSR